MSSDKRNNSNNDSPETDKEDNLPVNNDGRHLFTPRSRWSDDNRKMQTREAIYVIALLVFSLLLLACFGVLATNIADASCISVFGVVLPEVVIKYGLLSAGGLLGGTVYAAKWLYHAVAKGLWHEDRRLWRFMQPWISLGTTIGIWALIDSGFFRTAPQDISMLGIGFVIGYLSDQFLAKMKEITNVLFGRTERHPEKVPRDADGNP